MTRVPPDDVEQNGRKFKRDAVQDDGNALSVSSWNALAKTEAANGRNAISISSTVFKTAPYGRRYGCGRT
jgi:hypothetical protein